MSQEFKKIPQIIIKELETVLNSKSTLILKETIKSSSDLKKLKIEEKSELLNLGASYLIRKIYRIYENSEDNFLLKFLFDLSEIKGSNESLAFEGGLIEEGIKYFSFFQGIFSNLSKENINKNEREFTFLSSHKNTMSLWLSILCNIFIEEQIVKTIEEKIKSLIYSITSIMKFINDDRVLIIMKLLSIIFNVKPILGSLIESEKTLDFFWDLLQYYEFTSNWKMLSEVLYCTSKLAVSENFPFTFTSEKIDSLEFLVTMHLSFNDNRIAVLFPSMTKCFIELSKNKRFKMYLPLQTFENKIKIFYILFLNVKEISNLPGISIQDTFSLYQSLVDQALKWPEVSFKDIKLISLIGEYYLENETFLFLNCHIKLISCFALPNSASVKSEFSLLIISHLLKLLNAKKGKIGKSKIEIENEIVSLFENSIKNTFKNNEDLKKKQHSPKPQKEALRSQSTTKPQVCLDSKSICIYCETLNGIIHSRPLIFFRSLVEISQNLEDGKEIIRQFQLSVIQLLYQLINYWNTNLLRESDIVSLIMLVANDIIDSSLHAGVFIIFHTILRVHPQSFRIFEDIKYLKFHDAFINRFMDPFEIKSFQGNSSWIEQTENNSRLVSKGKFVPENDKFDGKFTSFFFRLHSILHIYKFYEEFAKILKNNGKTNLITVQSVEQLFDCIVIFRKHEALFIPVFPFFDEIGNWNDYRTILNENMLSSNEVLLLGFLSLVGRLPSLSSTTSLISCLYLHIEDCVKVSRPLPSDTAIESYLIALTKELQRIKLELSLILEENEKSTSKEIFNKRAVLSLLRLMISSIHSFNLLVPKNSGLRLKEILTKDVQNDDSDISFVNSVILEFLNSLEPFLKLSLSLKKKLGDKNIKRISLEAIRHDDPGSLSDTLFNVFLLFLWKISKTPGISEDIMESNSSNLILSTIGTLYLPKDTQICFAFFILNLTRGLPSISYPHFIPKLSKGLIQFCIHENTSRNALLPCFRAIRILLYGNTKQCMHFKELIPLIRTIPQFENENEIDNDKPFLEKLDNLEISMIPKSMIPTKNTNEDIISVGSLDSIDFEMLDNQNSESIFGLLEALDQIEQRQSKSKIPNDEIILQNEAKLLMKVINPANSVSVKKMSQSVNIQRKRLIEGAGTISLETLKVYKEESERLKSKTKQFDVLAKFEFEKSPERTKDIIQSKREFLMSFSKEKKSLKLPKLQTPTKQSFLNSQSNSILQTSNQSISIGSGLKFSANLVLNNSLDLHKNFILNQKGNLFTGFSNINPKDINSSTLSKDSLILRTNGSSLLYKIDEEYFKLLKEKL